jgi:hypothetical protein
MDYCLKKYDSLDLQETTFSPSRQTLEQEKSSKRNLQNAKQRHLLHKMKAEIHIDSGTLGGNLRARLLAVGGELLSCG